MSTVSLLYSRATQAYDAVEQIVALLKVGGSERAKSVRGALIALGVRCTSAMLLYATQVLLARWTGSHEYGIYVTAWTLVILLGSIACAGLNVALIRLLPEYRERGETAKLRGLVAGSRIFAFGTGLAIAAAAISVVVVSGPLVPAHYFWPMIIAFLCIPAYALTDLHDGLGRAQGWMSAALVPPYLLRPVMLVAGVFVAIVSCAAADAGMLAAAAVAATVGAMAVQTVIMERRLRSAVERGPRSYEFSRWFKISLPLVVIGVCDMLLNHVDIMVIALYLTPSDAGIYFAAAKTMSLMMYVHFAVGSAVANRLSALNANGDEAGLRACIRDGVNWTFWPSLLAGLAILALGQPLLSLFGDQFASGYHIMLVLVAGFLVRSLFGPIEFVLNMLGAQRQCAATLVAATVLNIAANFVLVPVWGTMGAAVATAATLGAASVANYMIARRTLGIDCAIWAKHQAGTRPVQPA